MKIYKCDRCGKECEPHSIAVANFDDDAQYIRATVESGIQGYGRSTLELCPKCLGELAFWVKKWWEDR